MDSNERQISRVRVGSVKFQVVLHVGISKVLTKFAKESQQNYIDEIFKIINEIRRIPRPVYELEDNNGTLIVGQFYGEEMTPVCVTKRTNYKLKNS
jgi:hypothetical protein